MKILSAKVVVTSPGRNFVTLKIATIDEELAAKYHYQRAYLPVNRLQDGTMWHW